MDIHLKHDYFCLKCKHLIIFGNENYNLVLKNYSLTTPPYLIYRLLSCSPVDIHTFMTNSGITFMIRAYLKCHQSLLSNDIKCFVTHLRRSKDDLVTTKNVQVFKTSAKQNTLQTVNIQS